MSDAQNQATLLLGRLNSGDEDAARVHQFFVASAQIHTKGADFAKMFVGFGLFNQTF